MLYGRCLRGYAPYAHGLQSRPIVDKTMDNSQEEID
jgi:hypothetical protein